MYVWNESEFLIAEITSSMRLMAEAEFRSHMKNSIVLNEQTVYARKSSRLAGILGELVFAELYPQAKKSKNLGYDFLYNGLRVDVKTKCRHYPPRISDQASVFSYQNGKHIDLLYFMSTTPEFERMWLCGWITISEFMHHPELERWKGGQVDTNNGMKFIADTHSLKYEYLSPIRIEKIEREGVIDRSRNGKQN